MKVLHIILFIILILYFIYSNNLLFGGKQCSSLENREQIFKDIKHLKFIYASTKYIKPYLLYYAQLQLLHKIKKIEGSAILIDYDKLNQESLNFIKIEINKINNFSDYIEKIDNNTQKPIISKLIGGNRQIKFKKTICEVLKYIHPKYNYLKERYKIIFNNKLTQAKQDIIRYINLLEARTTNLSSPDTNTYNQYILDYLILILPNARKIPGDNTKIQLLNNKNIDYITMSFKHKKPFIKYKKIKFIETIQSDVKLSDGNIVKFMNWPHKSPTPKTDSNGVKISPIVALRFLNAPTWVKTVHNLSFIHFRRDIYNVIRNYKLWFFNNAIFPNWTAQAENNDSFKNTSFYFLKYHPQTRSEFYDRFKSIVPLDNRCNTNSKHCANNKYGWEWDPNRNDALPKDCSDCPIELPEVIDGKKKYYIAYADYYGTGYKFLNEGSITNVLDEHYNQSEYNTLVPDHLKNTKNFSDVEYMNSSVHFKKPEYLTQISKKNIKINSESLNMYKFKLKNTLSFTKSPTNIKRKNSGNFDELKLDDVINFNFDKEHIIGHYQMSGLNRAPGDPSTGRVSSNDGNNFELEVGQLFNKRFHNWHNFEGFVLDPDKWYHFDNDDYNLTIRQFSEESWGPLNLLDLSFNQTTSKEYKNLLKQYLTT